nr:glycosyltransferase [Staphylococcus cohnii]
MQQNLFSQVPLDERQLTVIPHSIKAYKSLANENKLDRFVFIGRLGFQKQVDHLIKAYKQFLDYGYDTKLSIFGMDEDGQKKVLLDLIEQFGIQDQVEINAFTNNPLREFQQSKASLLTSKFEGFGLTVMESIEVGYPVIAYDVRYGPSEIINHGVNGYLVEPDNIKAFADCMAKIIDEPFNNVQTRPELSHDKAVENYKKLFQDIGYTK